MTHHILALLTIFQDLSSILTTNTLCWGVEGAPEHLVECRALLWEVAEVACNIDR